MLLHEICKIFIVQYSCKHTDKKFWEASALIYLLLISIWYFYIYIIGFGFEKVMFYHDENLTINFNFCNNLMFFLGLPLFCCVCIYISGKLVLLSLTVFTQVERVLCGTSIFCSNLFIWWPFLQFIQGLRHFIFG